MSTIFENNSVSQTGNGFGGAISSYQIRGKLAIKSSVLKGNVAKNGGALDLQESKSALQMEIIDTLFTSNLASSSGGALRCYDVHIERIARCTFNLNNAQSPAYINKGGAVFNMGKLTIEYSTFSGNAVGNYGPDVFADAISTTLIRDSSFTGNFTCCWSSCHL